MHKIKGMNQTKEIELAVLLNWEKQNTEYARKITETATTVVEPSWEQTLKMGNETKQ